MNHLLNCKNNRPHKFDDHNAQCINCNLSLKEYRQREQKIKDIKEAFQTLLNAASYDTNLLAEVMKHTTLKEHRTIQQRFLQSLANYIDLLTDFDTDLRNEAGINWCKSVSQIEHRFPFI